jgi:hypothetical protein
VKWDGRNNFSTTDSTKVRQVQNGKWYVVWPPEFRAPGIKVIGTE